MKSLIIGGAGFVGKHLVEHLYGELHHEVIVTKMVHETIAHEQGIRIYDLDILEKPSIVGLLKAEEPDFIFHLAAQSSVALSWKQPNLTCNVNINGTIHLLDAVRETGLKPRILLIGSGEEYGRVRPEDVPLSEEAKPTPGNVYAASKACQNMIGKIYADAYGLDVIMVRAFNHVGPGQAPFFVVSDFCKQVAEIEKGIHEPVIRVGNLGAKRDFTDVRDIVRAYALLIEKGIPGDTYNVGTGKAVLIEELLNRILSLSSSRIEVLVDRDRFRPVDVPIIEADISKLQKQIDWKPLIPLERTLIDTLNYWRNQH